MIDRGLSCLVIGADSLVGAGLLDLLEKTGTEVTGTTRRAVISGAKNRVFLALADDKAELFRPSGYSVVFFCTAITSLAVCEDDPSLSHRVNVVGTVDLIRGMLEQGIFAVFLSSNTVFDGETPWPAETSPHSPTTVYGRHKAEAEQLLRALPNAERYLAIVRLSKVVNGAHGMARQFMDKLRMGQSCPAFSDLLMSPVSLAYVTQGLLAVSRARRPGIYHLSGAAEISYAGFAQAIAHRIGAATNLVQSISVAQADIEVLFKPRHPGLGMMTTSERLNISPEPLDKVLDSLLDAAT